MESRLQPAKRNALEGALKSKPVTQFQCARRLKPGLLRNTCINWFCLGEFETEAFCISAQIIKQALSVSLLVDFHSLPHIEFPMFEQPINHASQFVRRRSDRRC